MLCFSFSSEFHSFNQIIDALFHPNLFCTYFWMNLKFHVCLFLLIFLRLSVFILLFVLILVQSITEFLLLLLLYHLHRYEQITCTSAESKTRRTETNKLITKRLRIYFGTTIEYLVICSLPAVFFFYHFCKMRDSIHQI